MSVTILEALQNANYNIRNASMTFQLQMGKEQLNNAVTLLDKGYDLYDEVDPLLDEYGNVDDVPEKED